MPNINIKNILLPLAVFLYLPFFFYIYLIVWGGLYDMLIRGIYISSLNIVTVAVSFLFWLLVTYYLALMLAKQSKKDKGFIILALVPVVYFFGFYSVNYFTQTNSTINQESIVPVKQCENLNNNLENAWLTYKHEKYKYSFDYPSEAQVENHDMGALDEMGVSGSGISFNIRVINPKNINPKARDLKDYSSRIWNFNKNDKNTFIVNKEVGEISTTTIDNKLAYQFTLNGSYEGGTGGYVLNEKNNYLLTENQGLYYMVWLPVDDSKAQQILKTLKF